MTAAESAYSQIDNEALHWLFLLKEYAAENNWQLTISHSREVGVTISVAHDAPVAIPDRGEKIEGGHRKTFEVGK